MTITVEQIKAARLLLGWSRGSGILTTFRQAISGSGSQWATNSESFQRVRMAIGGFWVVMKEPGMVTLCIRRTSRPAAPALKSKFGAFLNRTPIGAPEHQALLRMIGTLVEGATYAV
jgi:hypothetical protein